MQELSQLEFAELIDLLSEYTVKYSKLLVDGKRGEDFDFNKRMIKLLQAEIELRKSRGGLLNTKDWSPAAGVSQPHG